jgi:prenyltransferase beta subunit
MLAFILKLNIDTNNTGKWLDERDNKYSDLVNQAAFVRSRLLCKLLKAGKWNFALNQLLKVGQTIPPLPALTDYPHSDAHSPYSQYILLSLKEDLGVNTGNVQEILDSISAYRVESGGFSNISGGKQATTNATVAALAVMGQLQGYHDNDDIRYLYSIQDESGGFYANASAPVPDLLSTATSLFILKCYGITPRIDPNHFIDAHWLSSGGFCATLVDDSADVEYAFYGLLALGVS